VGRITNDERAAASYIEHLLSTVKTPLTGLKIVVDCANGAASHVAPAVYQRAGAAVIAIHHTPDGWNINENCGSTHLEDLQAAVVREGADFGVAHDGDSDRCLAVDAQGQVVDGDQIMTILANGFKSSEALKADTIVATVMSNLGFFHAMKASGINVITTSVGDRYVLEKMNEGDYSLGGEQSGHVIIRDHANTGDGILTALALAQEVARSGKSLADLASAMQRFPQVLINVSDVAKDKLPQSSTISQAVADAEKRLGDAGRVLLRASGTESLIRVMVEASSDSLAQEIATSLAAVVKAELGI
jgi:phosphoglucosamine mutase